MKNKSFPVILSLVIFLAAQVMGVAHAAAYGPGKHKHHGLICDIYLSTDQAKFAVPPPPPALNVPIFCGVTFVLPACVAHQGGEYPPGFPRAPPAFLPG